MSRRREQAESKAALERLEAQAEKTFAPPPEAGTRSDDWAERWGKRVGLIIGYGLALYLLWHLLSTYVLK